MFIGGPEPSIEAESVMVSCVLRGAASVCVAYGAWRVSRRSCCIYRGRLLRAVSDGQGERRGRERERLYPASPRSEAPETPPPPPPPPPPPQIVSNRRRPGGPRIRARGRLADRPRPRPRPAGDGRRTAIVDRASRRFTLRSRLELGCYGCSYVKLERHLRCRTIHVNSRALLYTGSRFICEVPCSVNTV